MGLLVEQASFKYNIVESSSTRMRIRGIYQLGDVKNENGRIYRRQMWEKLLGDGDVKARLENRQMVGQLGHPADGSTSLEHVSHVVDKLWLSEKHDEDCTECSKGNNSHVHIYGEEEILNTPSGRILRELYESGIKLGTSSRGSGDIDEGGYVKEGFKLGTFDHVIDPSTPGAYPKPINVAVAAIGKLSQKGASECELQSYQKLLTEYATPEAKQLYESIDMILKTPGKCGVRLSEWQDPYLSVDRGGGSYPSSEDREVKMKKCGHCGVLDSRYLVFKGTKEERGLCGRCAKEVGYNPETGQCELRTEEDSMDLTEELKQSRLKVDSLTSQLDELRISAREQLEAIAGEKDNAFERAIASERLANELLSRTKEYKIKFEHVSGKLDELNVLSVRYEASKKIIRSLVDEARKLSNVEGRLEAATRLVAAFVKEGRTAGRRQVDEFISQSLAGETAGRRGALSTLLVGSRSVREAKSRIDSVGQLTEKREMKKPSMVIPREGLPPQYRSNVRSQAGKTVEKSRTQLLIEGVIPGIR